MIKRLFDIISSLLVLSLIWPIIVFIIIWINIDSKGGAFYKQTRVGKGNKDFGLLKFRTMVPDADKAGKITVGNRDPRITKVGYYLRKFKLDEIPQLFNIIKGEMSVVGPRPEVRKYVSLYNSEQLKVLTVRPGLTDYASLEYINENEILAKSDNPNKTYIEVIMPAKLKLNEKYIQEANISTDIKIIIKTILKILQ